MLKTGKARILVVEDEVIIAMDIQRTLMRLGYQVPETVTTAEAALERIEALHPDLVLMDIHLSGEIDGIDLADVVRQRDRLPVVFLTAHSDEATLNRAKITEPYGYVLKPFEERELQIAIDIALYRHTAEMKLKQIERWLSTTLKSLGDGVIATNLGGKITFMNRMAEVLTGWPQHEALGRPLEEVLRLVHSATRAPVSNLVERVQANGVIVDLSPDTALINREGDDVPIDKSAAPIRDENEQAIGAVVVFRELTARKYVEEKIRHFAAHDVLTGLANEILLGDRLNLAFEHAKRYPDYAFALLLIDLDRFSTINDSHGDVFGDQVIAALGQRLRESSRGVDTLARTGGDEFAVLLNHVDDLFDIIHVANRIMDRITDPILVDGQEILLSASVGIVTSDQRYQRTEDMMNDGIYALRQAKADGSGHMRLFNSSQHESGLRILKLERELNQAAERGEFLLYFQPIVALDGGEVRGFEALLRWQYSPKVLLMPDDFLAIAEKIGVLAKVQAWMLDECCRQLRAWQASAPAHQGLSVAVNLSASQFYSPNLKTQVAQALQISGLKPGDLALDIAADTIALDPPVSAHILEELAELGVKRHLDDLGCRPSTLDMLENSRFDMFKIDRSLAESLTANDARKSAVARAILGLAAELGKDVIAEGIESAEQAERLLALGYRFGQGYWVSEPMDGKEVPAWLASRAGLIR